MFTAEILKIYGGEPSDADNLALKKEITTFFEGKDKQNDDSELNQWTKNLSQSKIKYAMATRRPTRI